MAPDFWGYFCFRKGSKHYVNHPVIKKTLTLDKSERLKSRKIIDGLFKGGKSFAVFPFRVYFNVVPGAGPDLQAGFSAPAKKFKKAVDRNRIKRLMREVYRLEKEPIKKIATEKKMVIHLFFIYTGKEMPSYEIVFSKIIVCLNRIIATTHEADTSPA